MLTVKPLGTASSDISNYYEALSKDDYYESGSEPAGQWHGLLSDTLGLNGEIKPGQLHRLFEGFHPGSGEQLANNAGDKHRSGWDLTFSSPKSVSVAWALADEPLQAKIAAAHDAAVRAGLDYLERNAFSSRDRGNSQSLKGIIAATYQHSTSREQDPQLHSHCAIGNLGIRQDGTVCAIDFDTRWKMAGGSIYRAELAHQLQQLGFDIERDGKSFRLSSIPEALCKKFSKRRTQILDYIEESGFDSAKSRDIAALATRRVKESPSRSILHAQWQREAVEAGYSLETLLSQITPNADAHRIRPDHDSLNLDGLIQELMDSQAVITRQQLETAIATEAQGRWGAAEIPRRVEEAIKQALDNPEAQGLIRLKLPSGQQPSRRQTIQYTSREMLQLEEACLSTAHARKAERQHVVTLSEALLDGLSVEQAQAVRHITQESGGIAAVVGLAGTGKSFMLARARQAWENSRQIVLGAALSGKAAEGLEQGSGIPSVTLHSLIADLDGGRLQLTDQHVIVLDEAGMVGTRQFHALLSQVNAAGSKLVAVGDPKQLQAINAGAIFRGIAEVTDYAKLSEIRRQESVEDRQMIHQLIDGQGNAVVEQLTQAGQLVVEVDDKVVHAMVSDWYRYRDPYRPGEALMLAGTKADAGALNQCARSLLKVEQRLHSEATLSTEHGERVFGIGERLLFTRNSKALGVKNGMLGTLTGWQLGGGESGISLSVALDSGETVMVDPGLYGHLDYGYAISVHKAQGLTTDNVNVLMSPNMVDREWAYVACSRHRKRLRVFVPESMDEDLVGSLARTRQKVLACDFGKIAEAGGLAAAQERKAIELERE